MLAEPSLVPPERSIWLDRSVEEEEWPEWLMEAPFLQGGGGSCGGFQEKAGGEVTGTYWPIAAAPAHSS